MHDHELCKLNAEDQGHAVECVEACRDEVMEAAVEGEAPFNSNVVGVGAGVKNSGGAFTGEPCVQLLVKDKLPLGMLRLGTILPESMGSMQTDVVEVGEICAGPRRTIRHHGTDHGPDALQLAKVLRRAAKERGPIARGLLEDLLDIIMQFCGDRPPARTSKFRPAPPGVSVGHVDITAGTLGVWVRDRDTGETFLLSNNHVLANSNAAAVGDPILQPGPADGGADGRDNLNQLARFTPLDFGSGFNLYDGAVSGDTDPDEVDRAILEIGEPAGLLAAADIQVGMEVQKSGRTTGLTRGTVNSVGVSVRVNYGGGRMARFDDQVQVTPGAFSDGGDSGSSILDDNRMLVCLLFAGSDFATIGSPMQYVFDGLNLEL